MMTRRDRHPAWRRRVQVVFLLVAVAAARHGSAAAPEGTIARVGLGRVNVVGFAPVGNRLALATEFGVELWNSETWERAEVLAEGVSAPCLAYSRDGTVLAANVFAHTGPRVRDTAVVKLWNTATYEEICSLPTGYAFAVALSPDGSLLAVGANSSTVAIWDVSRRREIATVDVSAHTPGVSFSPDGSLLATASGSLFNREPIKLWDVKKREDIATLTGQRAVFSVAFSPDGKLLATGGGEYQDPTVKLWDVASGGELATLLGHTHDARSVRFSPDGSLLASGSVDETVRLWDVASRSLFATLTGRGRIMSVSFSPDGSLLAAGGWGGTVSVWELPE